MHASNLRSGPNMRACALVWLGAMALSACGGGGSDDEPDVSSAPPLRPAPAPVIATGYLRSPLVAGLRFVSGGQQGITDAQGRFTYETNTGATVRLFVGALEVGELRGGIMVSPFDARSDVTESANLLRLLVLLDHDADASNGVQISTAIDTMAQTWRSLSFKTGEFESAAVSYVSDVASVEGGVRALPSAADSVAAMQASYNCLHSGVFTGSYFVSVDTGSSSRPDDVAGRLSMVAVTPDAQVFGVAYQTSPSATSTTLFIGERVLTPLDPTPNFSAAAFRLGAVMSGSFSSPDSIFGWMGTYSGWESFLRVSGSASGSRAAPVLAAHRFATSLLASSTRYLLALDVSAELAVTGTVVMGDTTMAAVRLSGSVQGDRLTVTSADGRYAVEAVFDATAHELRGTLRDGTGPVLPLGLDSRLGGCGL